MVRAGLLKGVSDMYRIGQIVWFEGKKWEIADSMNGMYYLGIRNKEGGWGKGSKSYGFIGSSNKEDSKCPFLHGLVPSRYISPILGGE